jgi:alkanesulfonate monooxygenase SsuD/methylene tetrahydromethanopterin reductase-like flavin-dependent oxidoreductase (luciferase family)
MAETTEATGFDSVWINDHFMFRSDERPEQLFPWMECFVGLGALAP